MEQVSVNGIFCNALLRYFGGRRNCLWVKFYWVEFTGHDPYHPPDYNYLGAPAVAPKIYIPFLVISLIPTSDRSKSKTDFYLSETLSYFQLLTYDFRYLMHAGSLSSDVDRKKINVLLNVIKDQCIR